MSGEIVNLLLIIVINYCLNQMVDVSLECDEFEHLFELF